jgi:predicted dehydrogenase
MRRPVAALSASSTVIFRDGGRMLESVDVDLVVIASEPAGHAELIALAVGHGRHVLCEKPLTLTAAEHERLAAALRADRAFIAVHQYRYSPTWVRVARWARSAAHLGVPVRISVEVQRCGTDPHASTAWRTDRAGNGGALADHGPHFLSLAWSIAGHLEVLSGQRRACGPHAETASALLRCGRGQMSLCVTTGAPARRTSVEVRSAGLVFSWSEHAASLRVAGRPVRRWTTPALSDREHVDALYLPLYRDILRNISDPLWCRQRRVEAMAVDGALVELLAQS